MAVMLSRGGRSWGIVVDVWMESTSARGHWEGVRERRLTQCIETILEAPLGHAVDVPCVAHAALFECPLQDHCGRRASRASRLKGARRFFWRSGLAERGGQRMKEAQ